MLGNVIAFLASIILAYSGILKNKKKILLFQTIYVTLFVISDIILGGITGAIINVIGMVRNVLCYKNKLGMKEKIIITVVSIILTFMFNNLYFIGLLPLIANIIYVWFMNVKNVKKFKLLITFTMVLWFIYDVSIKSYTSGLFDFINIVANIITVLK